MSDAPERIWTSSCGKLIVQDGMNKWASDIEYRRADLPPTLAQAMMVPEVRELVEALDNLLNAVDAYADTPPQSSAEALASCDVATSAEAARAALHRIGETK